jgi:hypothetical protein
MITTFINHYPDLLSSFLSPYSFVSILTFSNLFQMADKENIFKVISPRTVDYGATNSLVLLEPNSSPPLPLMIGMPTTADQLGHNKRRLDISDELALSHNKAGDNRGGALVEASSNIPKSASKAKKKRKSCMFSPPMLKKAKLNDLCQFTSHLSLEITSPSTNARSDIDAINNESPVLIDFLGRRSIDYFSVIPSASM